MRLLKLLVILVCTATLVLGCGDAPESGSASDNDLNVGQNNDSNNDNDSNANNDSNNTTNNDLPPGTKKNDDECPDADADHVLYWSDDSDVCDQFYEGHFFCPDDQVKFDDDCGCGCIKLEGDFLCDIDDCPSNTYCSYAGDDCTDPDATGQCQPKPDACTDDMAETCGCNGTIYYGSSSCAAPHSGVDTTGMAHCLEGECLEMYEDDDITFHGYTDEFCPDDDATDTWITCGEDEEPFVNDCGCGCRVLPDDDDDDDNGNGDDDDDSNDDDDTGMVCDTDGCPSGYYCYYSDGVCGETGVEGECVEVPTMCTTDMTDNCGCDGEIYTGSSTCAAQEQAGVDTHSDPDFCQ